MSEGEDMIARRMVMSRKAWDQIVELSKTMTEQRGYEVTTNDVAILAIEAGMKKARKGGKSRR